MSDSVTRIPCLVVPNKLAFSDGSDEKQVLTIYNAFNHPILFKILCTDPDAFIVSPSSGTIQALSSVNVVVYAKHVTTNGKTTLKLASGIARLMLETSDAKRTMRGQQVIPLEINMAKENVPSKSSAKNNSGTNADKNQSTGSQSNSNSDAQAKPAARKNSSPLSPLVTLVPLCLGVAVCYALANPEQVTMTLVDSHHDAIWVAFFIGMVTMYLTSRMFDNASK